MTFHLYDPGYCSYEHHDTLESAVKAGNDLIAIYRDQCDPEWPEYVEGIAVYEGDKPSDDFDGKLVAQSVEHNRIERPDDVDEDGYSPSEDLWFDSVDYYVDYKMGAV
ncbi:hypothetical protein [Sinorhizobium meliloti]|uniref:hypothetical protein n=1 Tax=Rhizobium meliloti TaxID=382 RepID=UPI000FDB43A2|nr:hypothetical protein [Sinorhizobium meliloti]RVI59946.1 hypothetical protein CN189_23800 [Sinorhizobium meliloti]